MFLKGSQVTANPSPTRLIYKNTLSKTQKGIQTIENTKSQEKNEKRIFKHYLRQ